MDQLYEFLSTASVLAIVAALVASVFGLLERTNRRTAGFGRAPFGADLENDRDIVRTLEEIRAAVARGRGRTDCQPGCRPALPVVPPGPVRVDVIG